MTTFCKVVYLLYMWTVCQHVWSQQQ
jgi:hypothetical protein